MPKNSGLKLTFDDGDLKRRLKQVDNAVRVEAIEKGLKSAALFLIANIKIYLVESSGLNVQTGNLLNSIELDELVISDKSYIMFGAHTVYAAIHEFGGIIQATHAPYLVFMIDGHLIRTKMVTIPARPYMRPVIDRDGAEALKLLGTTIGGIIDSNWSH